MGLSRGHTRNGSPSVRNIFGRILGPITYITDVSTALSSMTSKLLEAGHIQATNSTPWRRDTFNQLTQQFYSPCSEWIKPVRQILRPLHSASNLCARPSRQSLTTRRRVCVALGVFACCIICAQLTNTSDTTNRGSMYLRRQNEGGGRRLGRGARTDLLRLHRAS